jgi:hypothetical protein
MITYKLRLESYSDNPGIGWEAIPESDNLWIYEIDSQDNNFYQSIKTALSSFKKSADSNYKLILFINLWENDMVTPLDLDLRILKMLCEHNCSIQLWQ